MITLKTLIWKIRYFIALCRLLGWALDKWKAYWRTAKAAADYRIENNRRYGEPIEKPEEAAETDIEYTD